jgi:molybdate transport system ATP-binding protein
MSLDGNGCTTVPVRVRRRQPACRRPTAEFARRRRQVLHWLGIAELMDRHLPSLSSGEMRKTLLAHALLRRPRLLILDDVFTGLDPGFRVHLKRLLENLIRRGDVHLLLTVSHPDELPRGITHMLCVDRCRVVAHGTRAQMLRHDRVRELFRGDGASLRGPRRVPAARRRARPGGSEELVRLENVSVRYDGRAILDKVDWTIRRGESWALTGPNGSGKSTLLSLINGDNPQAYANHVHVFGRRRGSGESVWQLKKRIGWVSPELHLHFPQAQSVLAAVASGFQDSEGCYRRPSSRQRRAARRCLASLGLGDCGELPFGLLSAGLQRVALLARALVKSPDLLVLDEPCHGLDVAHRTRFVQTIEKLLRDTATTVIYVTHRSDEIPRGIRLFLRLRAGQVVHRGSRAEC